MIYLKVLVGGGIRWKREFDEDKLLFTINKKLFSILEDGDEIAFIPKAK